MNLKEKLDYHYQYFDKSKISPDPLEFLHLYENFYDIEIAGIISSIFAYGNVKQIISTLNKIHKIMNYEPHKFILNFDFEKDKILFENIKYRFYTSQDIAILFSILNFIYKNYGSLKNLFLQNYDEEEINLKNAISKFSLELILISEKLLGKSTSGIKFMFSDPYSGSACKRINLFLRWMIRKDELDFGIWNEIPPNKLVIPVDTHIARICKELKLTELKNVNWKMAEEITENLKKFDPIDPIKYDFAICHIGMRKMKF